MTNECNDQISLHNSTNSTITNQDYTELTHNKIHGRQKLIEGIYLVTDPQLTMVQAGRERSAVSTDHAWHTEAIERTAELVGELSRQGVHVIQLRWKNVDAGYFLQLAKACAETAQDGTQLFINNRIDVFLAARQLDLPYCGVHIGQTDLPVDTVRRMIGNEPLIGYSAASESELNHARKIAADIDYIGVGTVRSTSTKKDAPAPLGLSRIQQIAQEFPLPIAAIGGIIPQDITQIGNSAIHCAAIISAIVSADSPIQVAQQCVEYFDQGRAQYIKTKD